MKTKTNPAQHGIMNGSANTSAESPSDIVPDAATCDAENATLDGAVFSIGRNGYAELLARLDAPPQPNSHLRRALTATAPWEN